MECSSNQCCAIDNNFSRCKNACVGDSDHCQLHRETAVKMYHAYKKYQNKVDGLDLNKKIKDDKKYLKYLMDCYVLLNETYNLRMKHRKYAYVPECYDEGHDYQFTKLKTQITELENKLSLFYNYNIENQKKEIETFSEDDDETPTEIIKHTNTVNEKIRKYNKHRNNLDKWIEQYNEENRVIIERRLEYIRLIVEFVDSLFEEEEDNNYFIINVSVFNIVRKLYSIGYFESTFKPNKCENCDCGSYINVDVALVCPCVVNNNTIQKYFNLSNEDNLKFYYDKLVSNKEKIKPIIQDMNKLYKIYKDQIICIKLLFDWDPNQNRLKLVENYLPTKMKPSKMLAMTRLNNRAYARRMDTIFG
jgi:hypothetical protein